MPTTRARFAAATVCLAVIATHWLAAPTPVAAQQPPGSLTLRSLAETRLTQLPPGELYWCIENFDSVELARAAGGMWTLVVEAEGKVWSFTLGPRGGRTSAGAQVAEVGPIPRVAAARYLLRINDASGAPGSVTSVHSHPGSEAFFVLAGEQTIRGAHGTLRVAPGRGEAGHVPTRRCRCRAAERPAFMRS